MVQDYPRAIRERYGPKSARGQRVTLIASLVVAFGVVAIFITALVHLQSLVPGAGLLVAFVYSALILLTFNVFDLIVLDWLIVVSWRPSIVVLPDTKDMADYRGMGFHLRAFATGLIICLIGAGIAAAVFS
jgi:hypothetical protein